MDTRMNFHQSLNDLHKEVIEMGRMVEHNIHQSVQSLMTQDEELAKRTIEADDAVDQKMLVIEEKCLNLIALQQPMAGDLRMIGMALKIAIDLERIADHATDISKITIRLFGQKIVKPLIDIPRMAELAQQMLRECMTAFSEKDIHRAASLANLDDEVDKLYSTIHNDVVGLMGTDLTVNKQLTHLLLVAQYIERVADHTTNIGEGIIYLVTGKRKDLNV